MNNSHQHHSIFKTCTWLVITGLAVLLGACGGGSGGSDPLGDSADSVVSSGVAVDPYIVGARFEEVSADGSRIIQSLSSASDARGRFYFAYPVKDGSVIRLKSSSRGMHGNVPYEGILKRRIKASDSQGAVLSPLTTLLANGMSETELLNQLAAAGLSGLNAAQLDDDPMQGVSGATGGLNDAQLRLLQANMAINTLMLALGNFDYAGESQNSVRLADCVVLSRDTLDAAQFQALANSISAELGGAFTFDDLAAAAVEVQRTVASQIRQDLANGSSISVARFEQLRSSALADLSTIARDISAARLSDGGGSNGATLFANDCASCHTVGSGNGGMDLAGDGALLIAKFASGASHNGRSLSAGDIIAVGDYLDASTPSTPPPTPVTGDELYAAECQGCHGSLATSNISDRSASGIFAAIAANAGGMGYITLTSEQISLISNALPAVTLPPVPLPDRSGVEAYDQDCAGCHVLGSHDPAGSIDLAAKGSVIITKIEAGHMGKVLTATELTALADFADTFGSTPPPVVPRNPETVYNDLCTGCHMLSGYDQNGSIDLAGLGSVAVTKVASGHGGSVSTDELTSFAAWIDTFSPPPPPVVARDGETLYNQQCAACHKLYGYDPAGNIDLASMGNTALTKMVSGHGGTTSSQEQTNLANWLDTYAPAPPPVVDRNGETVYAENCAGCHKLYGYDASGNVDLASQGSLVISKVNSGHGGSVTSGELNNLAVWVDTFAPAPPPVVARGGQQIYDADCAACHKVNGYDATGTAPDIAGNGSGTTVKINAGHNGINLITEELGNLSAWLDTFQPGDPYAGSCNACHGQPPTSGAHDVHTALAGVGTDCAVCHDGASHNSSVDMAFPATWDAKSGSASSSGSSCSTTRCHGGQTTPDWYSGTLNSSTQCNSCHEYGTGEYNSYSSGKHRKHVVDKRYACSACHDSTKLASGHFDDLSTVSFEQSPATTIKSSMSYDGRTCQTAGCHGSKSW